MDSFFYRITSQSRLCIMIICFLLSGFFAARAADRYVATNGTDSGDCLTWATAASNIQFAVDLASNANDTVWVSNGVYVVTNQITITNRIMVRSVSGYSNTLVYADWPTWTTRCFYVINTGTVDGFTISNGHWIGSNNYSGGGGAYVGTATIQNCYFVNNYCTNDGFRSGGGGVYVHRFGIVSNCLFISNVNYYANRNNGIGGGGICLYNSSALDCTVISNYSNEEGGGIGGLRFGDGELCLISNCVISFNTAAFSGGGFQGELAVLTDCLIGNNQASPGSGGGIALQSMNVRNCTIISNTATYRGGGIYSMSGGLSTYISNCVVSGNRNISGSYGGAGIYIDTTYMGTKLDKCIIANNINSGNAGGGGVWITNAGQLVNCLIYGNSNIYGNGGGVLLGNAAAWTNIPYGLINCTIVGNYSAGEGGGITAIGPSNYIVNCIIDGNASFSNNYPNLYNTGVNSNNYYYSCATGVLFAPNQGNITSDPAFVNPASGNWRLKGYSPCMNTGTNQSWMTNAYDLDGRIRIRYGTVDMGAYEGIYEGSIFRIP